MVFLGRVLPGAARSEHGPPGLLWFGVSWSSQLPQDGCPAGLPVLRSPPETLLNTGAALAALQPGEAVAVLMSHYMSLERLSCSVVKPWQTCGAQATWASLRRLPNRTRSLQGQGVKFLAPAPARRQGCKLLRGCRDRGRRCTELHHGLDPSASLFPCTCPHRQPEALGDAWALHGSSSSAGLSRPVGARTLLPSVPGGGRAGAAQALLSSDWDPFPPSTCPTSGGHESPLSCHAGGNRTSWRQF